jgi:hypothetical protein
MPEKIDVLMNAMADCLYFDVDNTVDSVTIVPVPGATSRVANGAGNNVFTRGDSLRILSIGIRIPESFTVFNILANPPFPYLTVVPEGVITGDLFTNPNFSGTTQILPMENYELVIDAFLNCRESLDTIVPGRTLLDENFYLRVYPAYAFDVSMLGVPDSLNGKRFYVMPFIKVSHSIDLI